MLDIWIIFMEPTLRLWTGSKATGKQKKEKLRQENENEKWKTAAEPEVDVNVKRLSEDDTGGRDEKLAAA